MPMNSIGESRGERKKKWRPQTIGEATAPPNCKNGVASYEEEGVRRTSAYRQKRGKRAGHAFHWGGNETGKKGSHLCGDAK